MNVGELERIDRRLEEAERRLNAGDAAESARQVGRIVAEHPDLLRARLLQARALLGAGEPAEALATLNAADWYHQVDQAVGGIVDDRVTAAMLRAKALANLDRVEDACAALHHVLEARPSNREARRRLAMLLVQSGQNDQAEVHLRKLLASWPNDIAGLRLFTNVCEAAGRCEQALEAWHRLCRVQQHERRTLAEAEGAAPGDPTVDQAAALRTARLQRKAGRLNEAAVTYAALIGDDPDDPEVACEAADLAVELGDDDAAVKYLLAALKGTPDHADALRRLAKQDMRCGRFAQAGRTWWRLSRRPCADGRALAGLAVCALTLGRDAFAERILRRLRTTHSRIERRELMAEMWRLATPGRLLNTLCYDEATGPGPTILTQLVDEAEQTLTAHADQHDAYADLHYHTAMCRRRLGDWTGAAESLDRALDLNGGYLAAGRLKVEMLLADRDPAAAGEAITRIVAGGADASQDAARTGRQTS